MMATLQVNGQQRINDDDPAMPLLWFSRDALALTGDGCGLCGACTGRVNGEAVRAGNLCRRSSYRRIHRAIRAAAGRA